MARDYHYISADGHVEGPPERWVHRVPKEHRERAPRTIRSAAGTDYIQVEGRPLFNPGMSLFGGRNPEEYSLVGLTYEGTPGTGSPEQRLREMDQDGVDAEVLYPGSGSPLSARSIKNKNVYRALVRAYNDWLAEEYCAVAPDRLIGVGIIPETGLDDAVAELEHCAKLGLKTINLAAFPSGKAWPTPGDDGFWAKALALGMPLTIHKSMDVVPGRGEPMFPYAKRPEDEVTWDYVQRLSRYGIRAALNATQMVIAGVFDRFPDLQIYWAENNIGWIPIFLEQMDHTYKLHRYWAERDFGVPPLKHLPSEYVREFNYWGFFDDPIGVELRHRIGVDRILWNTDFPHAESPWPHSLEVLHAQFAGVPEEEQYKMVAGNAIRFFHLR